MCFVCVCFVCVGVFSVCGAFGMWRGLGVGAWSVRTACRLRVVWTWTDSIVCPDCVTSACVFVNLRT